MPTTPKPSGRTASTRANGAGKRATRGFAVIAWIETHCVFTNGEWLGKPFRLLPWQKRVVLELFELAPSGKRAKRWAYISVPKKNGKTELAAALGLYLLIGDGEPSPLVVCAAASEDQADLVFDAAKRMCELSPTLAAVTERFEREILVPSIPGAKLKRVAAAAGTNDGQNIHAVLIDELHEWVGPKGEAVHTVLTNGIGARRQPLIVQITTAGYDLETICGRQYEHAKLVAAGDIVDPSFYSYIVEADPDADYRDPDVWRAANPSFGVTVHEDFFLDQLSKKSESVFRRYFLNSWVDSEELWLPSGAWRDCVDPTVTLDRKLPISVGIDIGLKHDSTAIVVAQKQADERTVVRAKFWINPYPFGHALYESWELDIEQVRDYLRGLRTDYPAAAASRDGRAIPGPIYSYDPWQFVESAQMLEREGLLLNEITQNDARMVPPSTLLYELIVTGRVVHDGDPTLAAHLRNVLALPRGDRGWRLTKPRGSSKMIDGAIALAMAVFEAQREAPRRPWRAFAA